MKHAALAIILSFFGSVLMAHPIKMTTARLEISTTNGNARLTINFFIDDFEPELRKLYPQPSFNFDVPTEDMLASFKSYIQKNVSVALGDSILSFSDINIRRLEENVCQVEINGEATWLKRINHLKVKDTLLFSSFEKQSNILHLIIDEKLVKILQFYPNRPLEKVGW